MNDDRKQSGASDETDFSREVRTQAALKRKAQRGGKRSIWFGFGMSGLIGWSVIVPTLIGAVLGVWVDKNYPTRFSWTLTLLLLGLIIGCLSAWRWVAAEFRGIQEESDE
ncbi:MAG: AtpZ/AtpI family protein [Planctomycetales bacterium]|nr:AtpZ/AtpI family protein [Planctomycetales bacterium]